MVLLGGHPLLLDAAHPGGEIRVLHHRAGGNPLLALLHFQKQRQRIQFGGDFLLAGIVGFYGAEEFVTGDVAGGLAGEGVDRLDAAVIEDGQSAQGRYVYSISPHGAGERRQNCHEGNER